MNYSEHYERAVIGTILRDGAEALARVADLEAEHFYIGELKAVFAACTALDESGTAIDLVTVWEALRGRSDVLRGDLSLDASFLASLTDAAMVTRDIEFCAKGIAKHYLSRERIRAALRLSKNPNTQTARAVLAQLADIEDRELALEEGGHNELAEKAELINQALLEVERAKEDESQAILTGIKWWDDRVGGFYPTDLIILAARPGAGKTSIAVQILRNIMAASKNVLFISLEMERTQLMCRLLGADANISVAKLRTGKLEEVEFDRFSAAAGNLNKLGGEIAIADRTRHLSGIRNLARRFIHQHKKLDLVVVDYLQLATTTQRCDSREREVALISGSLKALAKEMKLPVLALAQLNRAIEGRVDPTPKLSDLRESGSIEQDADQIYFLARQKHSKFDLQADSRSVLSLAKNRHGETTDIPLIFEGERMRFR